jgi:predicted membrane channel-forming protein YqfA (hemolysin III family)
MSGPDSQEPASTPTGLDPVQVVPRPAGPGLWERLVAAAPVAARPGLRLAEKGAGTIAFLLGSLYDAVTLRRVDQLADNLILMTYLLLLGALLVVEQRLRSGMPTPNWAARHRKLVHFAAQFLFGGLFSAYVIFYFKSANGIGAMVFVGLLTVLLLVNEFLDEGLRAEPLRLALYCLCAFSLLLFFVPVVTGWPGPGLFLAAGVGAFLLGMGAAWGIHGRARKTLGLRAALFASVFAGLVGLDVLGLIPPVPMALMEAGTFHNVSRVSGGYELTYEEPPWYRAFDEDDSTFHLRPGDKAWCFTAVFAPSGMGTEIWHRWEHYDRNEGWVQTDRIRFDMKGGRAEGYRGYTRKASLSPGAWRVVVEGAGGREVGRVKFLVIEDAPKEGEELPERTWVVRTAE